MIDWIWPEVDRLEHQENWNEAKEYLLKAWQQNPMDLKKTVRLGFFCWYVVVEQGPLGITDADIDTDELESVLTEVTTFGLAHFMTEEDFLWCFGYMISMFPYYFGDYEQCEEKGISMLKRAYELYPEEPVYKYSYLGSFSNTYGTLKDELKQIQPVLEDRFKGEGLLSEYFKEVFG
ncbi:hypothetical protein [Exiguobacterium artemiae]|uniref:hypothetical protein n=1 Tax=Exiguobacterium artemiae TaxID=340145 RepID=UPI00047A49FD|nr:hypothetical protein [Exiguobacterium sibiricum]